MTKFSGFGPGKKGGPTKLRYDLSAGGGRIESEPPRKKRTTAVHTRFKPFKSAQIHRKTAKELGLVRKDGMTHFRSERELDRYLNYEKHHGRDTGWKDYRSRPRVDGLERERVW